MFRIASFNLLNLHYQGPRLGQERLSGTQPAEGSFHAILEVMPHERERPKRGQFMLDKKNGHGTYEWADGQVYKGAWLNDK